MSGAPLVSVIIVNYNTRELLRSSISSALSSAPAECEIIVVDNASTDGSSQMVEREFPGVRLLKNSLNERFAKPNNDAMRLARGEYFFLLNSDAELTPGALQELVRALAENPRAGMAGPQLLYPDGTIQRSCRGFMTLWTHACDMLGLDRLFPRSRLFASSEMTYFDHQSERWVDHLMAAAVLVRAGAVREVGMLDERLSIYFNDLDWSLRMHEAGWKVLFVPRAKVVHHSGRTGIGLLSDPAFFREQYRNVLDYYRKHFGAAAPFFYKVLLVVGFLPRTLYWSVRALAGRSELARARRSFAARSLLVGLGFWGV